MLEACGIFEDRSLTLVPNIRQGKCFFHVLVCCIGSAVYLAGQIGLELKILYSEASEAAKFLQKVVKVYIKQQITLHADLADIV